MPQHNSASAASTSWPRVLSGAVVGSATGISAVLLYTNGLFVAGLAQEFGLTRAQFGLGVLLVTISLAIANPFVGWLVDRFGARGLSVVGLLLLSVGFAALGRFTHSVSSYLLLQMLLALWLHPSHRDQTQSQSVTLGMNLLRTLEATTLPTQQPSRLDHSLLTADVNFTFNVCLQMTLTQQL